MIIAKGFGAVSKGHDDIDEDLAYRYANRMMAIYESRLAPTDRGLAAQPSRLMAASIRGGSVNTFA